MNPEGRRGAEEKLEQRSPARVGKLTTAWECRIPPHGSENPQMRSAVPEGSFTQNEAAEKKRNKHPEWWRREKLRRGGGGAKGKRVCEGVRVRVE